MIIRAVLLIVHLHGWRWVVHAMIIPVVVFPEPCFLLFRVNCLLVVLSCHLSGRVQSCSLLSRWHTNTIHHFLIHPSVWWVAYVVLIEVGRLDWVRVIYVDHSVKVTTSSQVSICIRPHWIWIPLFLFNSLYSESRAYELHATMLTAAIF